MPKVPEPPLTLEKAKAENRMDEFIAQQDARYPEGADRAAFVGLIGRATRPGTPPKAAGRTSRPDRDAG